MIYRYGIVFGILLAVCFATYYNSLHNPFMADDHVIFGDPKIKNLKFLPNAFYTASANPSEIFSTSQYYYRPLAFVTTMFSWAFFGADPYGYHVLNLFLFTIMCFMLFLFIALFFEDKRLALFSSLLFAVHPIHVFFVNYITSGIHSLRFIFMYASLILYFKWERKIGKALALFLFVLALLCHEASIILPAYVFFLAIFLRQWNIKAACLKTLPYIVVFIFYLFIRFKYVAVTNAFLPNAQMLLTWTSYLGAFSKLTYLYMSKLFIPDGIGFSWNSDIGARFNFIWIGGLFVLLIGWSILFAFNRQSKIFFAVTWVFIGFLPLTIGSLSMPFLGLVIEPQWITFSSVGFFILLGFMFKNLLLRVHKELIKGLFVLVLILWGSITMYHNWIWGNELRYYAYWVEQFEPKGSMHPILLADFFLGKKEYKQARYYYERSLPGIDDAKTYNNLGMIDSEEGLLDDAHAHFLKSLQINPANAFVHNNLGRLYLRQNKENLAQQHLLKAITLDKYAVQPRVNLARIYFNRKQFSKAIDMYKSVLDIIPNEVGSLLGLMDVYIEQQDKVQLQVILKRLSSCKDAVILVKVANTLAQNGVGNWAVTFYQKAISVDSRYKNSYLEAGKFLANMGKFDEAIHIWQIGNSVAPYDPAFKELIEKASVLRLKS